MKQLLPRLSFSPDLASSDYLLSVLKRAPKIAETEVYFEAKNYITFETMWMEKVKFCLKLFVLLVILRTYLCLKRN